MALHKSTLIAGPLAVLLLWLACALPSLGRSRLEDVDELTHARVAQAAAVEGRWWPLVLGGRTFYEKPPLLLWLAGATARLSGRPSAAWPYRVWTCLGAGLSLAALVFLGFLLERPWVGYVSALTLALQGDFLFHSRFFTFDTPFLACALASLGLSARAVRSGRGRDWWPAGLALGLAAAFKSWFVLALFPAYAIAFASALPRGSRKPAALALTLPPLLALTLWLALYVDWNGWGFLAEEWSGNLWGRALGRVNQADPQGHAAFYLKWAAQSAPALLPWALAVPLGLAPGSGRPGQGQGAEDGAWAFTRAWTWGLCLSWLLGLALVRAETINYPLPLEAGLCLALGLEVSDGRGRGRRLAQAALLGLSVLAVLNVVDSAWTFTLGAATGLVWLWAARASGPDAGTGPAPGPAPRSVLGFGPAWPGGLSLTLGLGLVCLLSGPAYGLLYRPLDPSRPVADLLLSHPPRVSGEVLWVIGGPTQAVEFYGVPYDVRRLAVLPARRPAQAALVETRGGWVFYPARAVRP